MNEKFRTEKLSDFFQSEYFSVRNSILSRKFFRPKFLVFQNFLEKVLSDLETHKSDIEFLKIQFTWLFFKLRVKSSKKNVTVIRCNTKAVNRIKKLKKTYLPRNNWALPAQSIFSTRL